MHNKNRIQEKMKTSLAFKFNYLVEIFNEINENMLLNDYFHQIKVINQYGDVFEFTKSKQSFKLFKKSLPRKRGFLRSRQEKYFFLNIWINYCYCNL